MTTQNKWLPCPFCGGTKLRSGGDDKTVMVWCEDCEATGPNGYAGKAEWNTRAATRSMPLQDHGWQDISTAPKSGDQVLLWSEAWEMSWGIQIGSFGEGKWHCGEGSVAEGEMEFDDDDPYPIGPTHWRPLPRRPMVAEQETKS